MSTNRHPLLWNVRSGRGTLMALHLTCWLLAVLFLATTSCRLGGAGKNQEDFFTSGSPEADQRAAQEMAQAEQLADGQEDDVRTDGPPHRPVQAEGKLTLYERLGSEAGISNIVADFVPRVLNDPRVNWQREGVRRGGLFRRDRTDPWNPTPENVARLERHFIQFLSLATGGPTRYEGEDMESTHEDMRISNSEFDAAVGDLKVSLDKLRIPNREQKELLAIIESTRPQIVTER